MAAPDPIFGNLNEVQAEVVRHVKGPVLIIAGAGSGKTRALTHRIAYLIDQGVPPWQILAVTFTNKAAREMKERVRNLLHIIGTDDIEPEKFGAGRLPVMGTFHSICARILRRDIENLGRDRRFVIYDKDDQEKLMKDVLKEMNVNEKELRPAAALTYIGRFKSEALKPKDAAEQAASDRLNRIAQVYARYQQALATANALDFDDILLETVRLFHEHRNVLERYQATWRFLHVDEYQDTNHAQYLLLTLLAQKDGNICVIGDPDQSIYAFRGSDIRNILEFQKDYPKAKEYKLERNYRSTQLILDAAGAVIQNNPNRPEKTMWTDRKDGPKVLVQEISDERAEAMTVIQSVIAERTAGTSLHEQAILYRTNAQSRLLEEACLRAGVPYRLVGGVKFYARREVKDILAYLHLIQNPQDTVSLLRVINVPARKIGATTLERMQLFGRKRGLSLWETLHVIDEIESIAEPTRVRLREFVHLLEQQQEKASRMVVSHLALDLLEKTNFEQWLRDETEEGEARWENVQELITVMHKYDALDPLVSLSSFLEEVALISEVDALQEDDDALTLMTLHLCKGLEFDHVLITGCEEGILPHSNSLFDKNQLEEECRLLYVGMTRAKTRLQLFFARSRTLFGQTRTNAPSRFLDSLPESVTERRSDDILSAFAWASRAGQQKAWTNHDLPRSTVEEGFDVEFNQDVAFMEEQRSELATGSRVQHPTFGKGTVISRRGDVVEIHFDSGQRKHLALSVAPLTVLP